jgi:hypothetical protein
MEPQDYQPTCRGKQKAGTWTGCDEWLLARIAVGWDSRVQGPSQLAAHSE